LPPWTQEAGLALDDLVDVTMFNKDDMLEVSRAAKSHLLKQQRDGKPVRWTIPLMQSTLVTFESIDMSLILSYDSPCVRPCPSSDDPRCRLVMKYTPHTPLLCSPGAEPSA
jgi:hypothetical protein